jgi:hypothetical protein
MKFPFPGFLLLLPSVFWGIIFVGTVSFNLPNLRFSLKQNKQFNSLKYILFAWSSSYSRTKYLFSTVAMGSTA